MFMPKKPGLAPVPDRKNKTRPGTSSGEKVSYIGISKNSINPFKHKNADKLMNQPQLSIKERVAAMKRQQEMEKMQSTSKATPVPQHERVAKNLPDAPTFVPDEKSTLIDRQIFENRPEKTFPLRISNKMHLEKYMVAKWPRIDFKHPLSQLSNWRSPSTMIRDCKHVPYSSDKVPGLKMTQEAIEAQNREDPVEGRGSEYKKQYKELQRAIKKGYNNKRKIDVDELPLELSISYFDKKIADHNQRASGIPQDQKIPTTRSEYTGTREHMNESSMYFIFYLGRDEEDSSKMICEACPVDSSYSFKPKIKHKTLSIEEAEEYWDGRHKILNQSAFMNKLKKKLDVEGEEGGKGSGESRSKNKKSGLQLLEGGSDNEVSDEDMNSDDDLNLYQKLSKKQKKQEHQLKKAGKLHTRGIANDDDEAQEDLQDGDDEGDEIDYASDNSSDFEEDENDRDRDIKGFGENSTKVNLAENTDTITNKNDNKTGLSDIDSSDNSDDENVPSSDSSFEEDEDEDTITLPVGPNGIPQDILDEDESSNPDSNLMNQNIMSNASHHSSTASHHSISDFQMHDENSRGSFSGSKRSFSPTNEISSGQNSQVSVPGPSSAKRQKLESNSRSNTPTTIDDNSSTIGLEVIKKYLKRPITMKKLLEKIQKLYGSRLTNEYIVEDITTAIKKLDNEGKLIKTAKPGKKEEVQYCLRL